MKVVIIEDEILLRETNRTLLTNNFPDMKLVGEAGTVADSIELIQTIQPDLVLMDIELADGNCFQILQACKPYTFKVIFITAYNQYAIKAIKFSAIDYILKPVNEYEFCNAINKAITQNKNDESLLQTRHFEDQYTSKETPHKIMLRTVESLHLIDICDIQYCKSDNSYTAFHINNQKPILISKGIKEYAELLAECGFVRPHQSYLVNTVNIARIDKTDGGYIILNDGTEIPISKRLKQSVLDELDKIIK